MEKEFENRTQWRDWLETNHSHESEIWLVISKKKNRKTKFGLDEAVEEALCFGWIDSILKPIDSTKYMLRFSPRKKKSVWSKRNIDRVNTLIANGKMKNSGLSKVHEAKTNGNWQAAIQRENIENIPSDLKNALRKQKGAIAAYRALIPSKKKQYLYWLETAKQEKTRKTRINKIVEKMNNKK
ncbi:MAG: YdeI/OmpD-associated family protein [Sedimentisphaerales bacterium]|nr:YdeI/OmpD-associated family protein [Sedimentisphaerales bacterium]